MIHIAYIGNGKSTNRYHLPFVLTLPALFKVTKIFARSLKQDWSAHQGIQYTNNLDDILLDPSIDAVVVATPSHTHFEFAKKVLESGKHCLVEKPFTTNVQEAKVLFDFARSKNLVIMPYQNRRFDSDLLTLQKLLKNDVLGEVFEVNFTWDSDRALGIPTITEGSIDNSLVYGLGTHSLDQALYTFGSPLHYQAIATQSKGPGDRKSVV